MLDAKELGQFRPISFLKMDNGKSTTDCQRLEVGIAAGCTISVDHPFCDGEGNASKIYKLRQHPCKYTNEGIYGRYCNPIETSECS